MKKVQLTVSDIISCLGDDYVSVFGETEGVIVDNLADPQHVNERTLDWVKTSNPNKQSIAETSPARVVLADSSVVYSEIMCKQKKVLLYVKKPRAAMIKVAYHFFLEKQQPGIHPSAIIDTDAVIDATAHIGAGCVVGKAVIGAGTVLMPNVVVYDDVKIGDRCLIQAGAVIGTDGLGCSRDSEGKLTKFPHLGGVIIGNDVEIGANSQIARGALSDTVIKDGCKMNGLCFIAHNCVLEENVWITGDTMLCGSCHVGKNATIFSDVIIRDQRAIGESVTIGMGSVVTKNIPDRETWLGNPAHKREK
jgi:UDP-3-O-[3-hydroxymyristoyl] glucosamine N-acyltransferase